MREFILLFGLPFFLLDAWIHKDDIIIDFAGGVEPDFSFFVDYDYDFHFSN